MWEKSADQDGRAVQTWFSGSILISERWSILVSGHTREVYDRVPDDSDPNGSRLEGPKQVELPVALEFVARPFEEATLFEIASAFQNITRHRRPPPGFGPVDALRYGRQRGRGQLRVKFSTRSFCNH
jgi:hypothetical protein